MQYKKFFSAAALVTLLSVSNYLSADPMGSEDGGETSYYVRGQYNAEFFNIMSDKDLKSNGGSGTEFTTLKGHSKTSTATTAVDYKPKYVTSYKSGSIAAGLKMEDNIGVELEVLYSQLDVDGAGYKDTAGGADAPNNAEKFGVGGLLSKDNTKASNNYIGENKGYTTIAGMVNAYYNVDLGNENIPVTPYVGVGVGVARVNFAGADHWKPAYQAKAGVSYAVTSDIKVYGGYRYFGLYGNEFEKVTLTKTNASGADPVTETKTVTLQQDGMVGMHGVEAGVMFNF